MNIVLLTNEYPPNVYGGAGVHVEHLARELSRLEAQAQKINIFCFGGQKEYCENRNVEGVNPCFDFPTVDARYGKLLDTLLRNLVMTASVREADIIHCHTWYTHFAGFLLKQLFAVPLVVTTHSLEPRRPWKEEQLGSGYKISTWLEKTAYENADGVIAVSGAMKQDVHDLYRVPMEKIRVIHNGIDLNRYKPAPNPEVLKKYGIDPDIPFVLFVGRITRQKGVIHLLRAIKHLESGLQVVLCAGAPDTQEIGMEMAENLERARAGSPNKVVWIPQFLPRADIIPLYTHADLFVCPSIYEPFGIINLEAMACETPVVASAVGGIPEIVVQGETGLLVPLEAAGAGDAEPRDPEKFARDLADAVNVLLRSPENLRRMGFEARRRVEKYFGWDQVARQTLDFYREIIKKAKTI